VTLGTGFLSVDLDSHGCLERARGLGKVSCGNLDTTSVTSGFMTFKRRVYVGRQRGQEAMVISPSFKEGVCPAEW